MNRMKSQVITNSMKRKVKAGGHVFYYVGEYIYLSQAVSFRNRQDKDIERRLKELLLHEETNKG